MEKDKGMATAIKCMEWAAQEGVIIDGMKVAHLQGRGNSLVASLTKSPCSSIIVPARLLLTLSNIEAFANDNQDFRVILEEWSGRVAMTSRRAIILLMAFSARHGSPWSIYLESLPTHIDSPVFWQAHERRLLEGTSIEGVAEDKIAFLQAWLGYQQSLEQASTFTQDITFKELMLYEMLVDSRALLSSEDDSCMVPCIDFANHSSLRPPVLGAQNAVWEMTNGEFHLTTLSMLRDGDEVLFSYGKRGNAELLCKYGFVEEYQVLNGSRSITLEIPLAPQQTFLCQFGEPSFKVSSQDSEEFLLQQESPFLWIYCLSGETEVDWEQKTYRGQSLTTGELLTRLQQESVWPWLYYKASTLCLHCVLQSLERLSMTEQDESLRCIAEAVEPALLTLVDAVRDSERVTYEACADRLESLRTRLSLDPSVAARLERSAEIDSARTSP